MQEASRSSYLGIKEGIRLLQQYLRRLADQSSTAEDQDFSSTTTKVLFQRMLARLLAWRSQVALRGSQFLERYRCELQCLLVYLIERRCLQSRSCSLLSESLYGGRRVCLVDDPEDSTRKRMRDLKQRDKTRIAFLTALGPYVLTQLDRLSKMYQGRPWENMKRFERLFRFMYPYLRRTAAGTQLLCRWRFLLGKSVYYDPWSWLLGQVVRRATHQDLQEGEADAAGQVAKSNSKQLVAQTAPFLGCVIAVSILASWSAQILEEWRNSRSTGPRAATTREPSNDVESSDGSIPPPPSTPLVLQHQNVNSDACPLCKRPRVYPTSCKGFVYCLPCILPYLQQHGKSPTTGEICDENSLVRLFEPRQ